MSTEPTVLVVDAVPMFRELGTVFLSRYACVHTAASGAEALELARRERPRVVVVDLHLPDLPGTRVCEEIRADEATAGTTVVALGARTASEHAQAIRAGAADVLSKPLSRATLVESVARFLNEDNPRGLPRVPLQAPIRVSIDGGEHWGTVRNLSRGGVFIEADWAALPEAEMALQFRLPEVAPLLSPTALLVWRRRGSGSDAPGPEGMGVRFLALERAEARSLNDFVHERNVPPTGATDMANPGEAVGGGTG